MDNEIVTSISNLPNKLPILPLEGPPLFPGMMTQMLVSKKNLLQIIEKAELHNNFLGLVTMKNPPHKGPLKFTDLNTVGTIAKIHKKNTLQDGEQVSVFLAILERFTIVDAVKFNHPLVAKIRYNFEKEIVGKKKNPELVALTRSLISELKQIISNNPLFTEDVRLNMVNIDKPGQIADFTTSLLNINRDEQQDILETFDISTRIIKVLTFLNREKELIALQQKVQSQISDHVESHKREHFLREMLKEIKEELGEPIDGKTEEIKEFRERLATLPMEESTRKQIEKDLYKLELLEPHNPEHHILSSYLEKVIELPWADPVKTPANLKNTEKILNDQHYGMEKVKERIIEHLAIRHMDKSEAKSIICMVGPPGVGKTSIARSIAEAMGKKLYHFSVGGMRDEAEIKGHRRTYIGAMPGKIIQGLLNVKEKDPVFVIDEIDKLGSYSHGDPASAMLEVLDPVQNAHFRDLYMDIPFDLSKIFFITTANSLHTIPKPLIDRMEIIHLSGYIDEEKLAIAQKYIVPKSLKAHGLAKGQIKFTSKALKYIAEHYAREAGMRIFEQCVNKITRKVTTHYMKEKELQAKSKSLKNFWPYYIDVEKLETYLGIAPFREHIYNKATVAGTSLGLAWTSAGGEVLVIEAQAIKSDKALKLTGTLGDVMKESAQIAYTLSKKIFSQLSNSTVYNLGKNIDYNFFNEHEIHLHVPEGATPKDGPSAGITIASAMISLATNTPIEKKFAMTGEVSLVNQVLPIGGLREKIVAARRNNIKNIIIPKANISDYEEIPSYIKKNITVYPVVHVEEVFALLFPKKQFSKSSPPPIHNKPKNTPEKKSVKKSVKKSKPTQKQAVHLTKKTIKSPPTITPKGSTTKKKHPSTNTDTNNSPKT